MDCYSIPVGAKILTEGELYESLRFQSMISTTAGFLYVFVLGVGVPTLAYLTARRPDIQSVPRRALYLSAVISQWFLALLGGLVVLATGRGLQEAGFRGLPAESLLLWSLLITSVGLVALGIWLILEHVGWWPAESDLVRLLLPETNGEKVWAVLLVAPTAAFCEEFVYRGYLLAQLTDWLGSGLWALIISSVLFALAHVYQGLRGMARVALLGALLAYPVLRLGSLYPSMVAHFVIDAVALAWLGPRFVDRKPAG